MNDATYDILNEQILLAEVAAGSRAAVAVDVAVLRDLLETWRRTVDADREWDSFG